MIQHQNKFLPESKPHALIRTFVRKTRLWSNVVTSSRAFWNINFYMYVQTCVLWPNGRVHLLTSASMLSSIPRVLSVNNRTCRRLTCVGWPDGKKHVSTCAQIEYRLKWTGPGVNASHCKSTQVLAKSKTDTSWKRVCLRLGLVRLTLS